MHPLDVFDSLKSVADCIECPEPFCLSQRLEDSECSGQGFRGEYPAVYVPDLVSSRSLMKYNSNMIEENAERDLLTVGAVASVVGDDVEVLRPGLDDLAQSGRSHSPHAGRTRLQTTALTPSTMPRTYWNDSPCMRPIP
jgi:hypothetical protein